jgi:hypothetical protein
MRFTRSLRKRRQEHAKRSSSERWANSTRFAFTDESGMSGSFLKVPTQSAPMLAWTSTLGVNVGGLPADNLLGRVQY